MSKMENSPFFDGIREEWEAKGEARGRLDMLFDVLEAKFGKIPVDLHNRLSVLNNNEAIKNTLKKVIDASTINEFIHMLEN
ncbi:MAG: hypothetical protein AB1815_05815 [Bacillota bacterium]